MNLILIILAPEVISIFATIEYREAIYVVPPVALSVFFIFLYSFFANFEFYYKKTFFIMVSSVIGAALNIVLNYIFIQQFGYIAAAYTTLFCYMIYSFAHYIAMRAVCNKFLNGVKVYNLTILCLISLFLTVCGFGIMFTYNYPFIRYGIVTVGVVIALSNRKKILKFVKILSN
jgi:O-antigen/teichoic acid export membrane protein